MIKLSWVSNEKELGTFLQIRDIENKYFITKGKGDSYFTLTIGPEFRKLFSTLESAKEFADRHNTECYLNKN